MAQARVVTYRENGTVYDEADTRDMGAEFKPEQYKNALAQDYARTMRAQLRRHEVDGYTVVTYCDGTSTDSRCAHAYLWGRDVCSVCGRVMEDA